MWLGLASAFRADFCICREEGPDGVAGCLDADPGGCGTAPAGQTIFPLRS